MLKYIKNLFKFDKLKSNKVIRDLDKMYSKAPFIDVYWTQIKTFLNLYLFLKAVSLALMIVGIIAAVIIVVVL